MNAATINVDRTRRGAWEVRLPGDGKRLLCPTLDEAVRVGHRCAADREPSELVVHDAYYRVLHREHVTAGTSHH